MTTQEILQKAHATAADLSALTTEKKNAALTAMAAALMAQKDTILTANRQDVEELRT